MMTRTLALLFLAKAVPTGDVSALYPQGILGEVTSPSCVSTGNWHPEREARLSQLCVAGSEADTEDAKPRYIVFGGENSRTADRLALSRAKEMEGKFDAALIWKKTGWGKEKAGSWVYEVSDEDAKIKTVPGLKELPRGEAVTVQLGDLLDHPLLFKAYPQLAAILVKVYNAAQVESEGDPDDADVATTTPSRIWRPASIEIARRINDFLPTLLHEVQHILEGYENLDYGPYTAEYDERIGEVRARNVERRLRMTASARRRQPPHTTYDTPHSKVRISPNRGK